MDPRGPHSDPLGSRCSCVNQELVLKQLAELKVSFENFRTLFLPFSDSFKSGVGLLSLWVSSSTNGALSDLG